MSHLMIGVFPDAPEGLTLAELPRGSASLYLVNDDAGECLGIGTPDELAELVECGVLPSAHQLTFVLELAL